MKHFVHIIEHGTERVESELGPYDSERTAERADDGVNRNLDHSRFYTMVRSYEQATDTTPGEPFYGRNADGTLVKEPTA